MTARAVMSACEFMTQRFGEADGTPRLLTTLEGLVVDDGAVVGVMLSDCEGAQTYVKAANRGVLLVTSGMGANRALLHKYVPTAYECCKMSCCGVQDMGEGIRMGLGAAADGFDQCMQFDGGIDYPDWNACLYNSAVQIARQPWPGITLYGECNPYIPGGGAAQLPSRP